MLIKNEKTIEPIVKIQMHYRFFTLEVLNPKHYEIIMDLIEGLLNNLTVYEENPNGESQRRKLYLEHNNVLYLPDTLYYQVVSTIRTMYPDREYFILVDIHKYTSSKLGLKVKSNYKLRDYQEQYHDIIVNGGTDRIFVDLRTGSGKASWVKSRILTTRGWKLLGDIKVGEEIWTNEYTPSRVEAIYPQGKKQLYRIFTLDGREHVCTEDHLWEIYIPDNGEYRVMSLKEIMTLKKTKTILIPTLVRGLHSDCNYLLKIFNNLLKKLDADNDENTSILPNGKICKTIYTNDDNKYLVDELKRLSYALGVKFEYHDLEYPYKKFTFVVPDDVEDLRDSIDSVVDRVIYTQLMKIVPDIVDDAMCIKVSNKEALYIVDDFLVTHNTFISTHSVVTMDKKVGVVVLPRYIDKWEEDFLEYTDIDKNKIYKVQGRSSLEYVLEHADDYKVIIFSVRTLYNVLKDFVDPEVESTIDPTKLFRELGIGVILSDETHQELNTVFNILMYSDVEKIIGMSATFISNRMSERKVQELLFPSKTRVSNLCTFDNYITYINAPYNIDFRSYRINTSSYMGYSHTAYEKSILKYRDLLNSYFEMIYNKIEEDYLTRRKDGERALIYFSLVDMCRLFANYLSKKESISALKLKVGKYTQEEPYETIFKLDILCSTLGSIGVGFNIPNLISIYHTVCVGSNKSNLQSIGRLRKLKDSECRFYNLYAINLKKQDQLAKARTAQCKTVVKTMRTDFSGYVGKEFKK